MSTAAEIIRASIEALPDTYAGQHHSVWSSDADAVFSNDGPRRSWILTGLPDSLAAHIALLASPDVAEALEDLLNALERWEWVGSDKAMDTHVGATVGLERAHHALTALLTRRSAAASAAAPDRAAHRVA